MDESKKMILEKRIEKTMKALEKNKMKPFYAENRQQALELVKELLQPGQTVACGGSVTLDECGILQLLRSGDYHFSGPLCARTDSRTVQGDAQTGISGGRLPVECQCHHRKRGAVQCGRKFQPGGSAGFWTRQRDSGSGLQ